MIRARYLKLDGNKSLPKDIIGEVIYESLHFITLKTKNYNTSINKYDVLMGIIEIVSI